MALSAFLSIYPSSIDILYPSINPSIYLVDPDHEDNLVLVSEILDDLIDDVTRQITSHFMFTRQLL